MKYLLLIPLLLCFTLVHSQSKKELLSDIDKSIKSLEGIINLASLKLEIASATKSKFDPNNDDNFQNRSLANATVDQQKLKTIFENVTVTNDLLHPYNFITIKKNNDELLNLLRLDNFYFLNNPTKAPSYLPTQIEFLDGSKLTDSLPIISKSTLTQKYSITKFNDGEKYTYVKVEQMNEIEKMVWETSSYCEPFVIQTPKPIKSISFKIALYIPKKLEYSQSASDNKINTKYGIITIDTIVENKVYCTIPDIDNDNLKVEAYYKNDKILKEKGYSFNTLGTSGQLETYEQWITTLKNAKVLVEKNKIKNQKELEAYFKSNAIHTKTSSQEVSYKKGFYTFSGPVSKVTFIIMDTLNESITYDETFIVENENVQEKLAQDFKTDKVGLIDLSGKWLVEPTFNKYFRPINKFFYWDQIDNHQDYYWFDAKNKKFKKVNYKDVDKEVFAQQYLIVTSMNNSLKGVVDGVTGEVVLPFEYESIKCQDNNYWKVKKNDSYGILDHQFKVVMPIMYPNVNVVGNYIYEASKWETSDVYDLKANSITKGKYKKIKGTFNNDLLLIENTKTLKNGNITTNYYYIDPKGSVKIDVGALGLEDAEEFSAGFAKVKNKNGKYGYINTKGAIAIPCQYQYAYKFYSSSKLGLVKIEDNNYVLIDANGKIVKRLPGDYIEGKRKSKDKESRILMSDKKSFNEYGEEVEYDRSDYW